MSNKAFKALWQQSEAPEPGTTSKFVLGVLVAGGIYSIFRFGNWWFKEGHVAELWLFIVLSVVVWYGVFRILLIWVNHLGIKKPKPKKALQGLKVAIFTTSSPGEPLSMFEKTLEACARINYPHTTYLLDDTRDPKFKQLAEKYGAVWLELLDLPGAKAGKINKALSLTQEDFILVLDPDHIPFPNFLDEVLGYFDDENVGFVQVSQAYYNQYRSFTAKAAAEQTYTFYGPTQMGLFGYNCAVAIGANCTFRRKALESAGGHGVGLAEDLVTSIRIHAEKWKSVYHPVVLSRGLVPEDFGSFCKQQMKWARGVHEVLFDEVPRLFKKLSFWQKLSYSGIGTYYLEGLCTLIYMLFPFFYFWFDVVPARMYFIEFLQFGFPVLLFSVLIYFHVQKWMCHAPSEKGLHWRGTVMKFACWPVFLLGFVYSVLGKKIPYIPTAKQAVVGKISAFAKPLLLHVLVFILTMGWSFYKRAFVLDDAELVGSAERFYAMLGFASIPFILSILGLYAVADSQKLDEASPWEDVNLSDIKTYNRFANENPI